MTALATLPTLAGRGRSCCSCAHARLGAGLTGFEVMNDALARARRASTSPQLRQPLAAGALDRAARAVRRRRRGARRGRVRGAARRRRSSAALIDDAAVAASLEQAQRDVAPARDRSRSRRAAEGANIKHDIALPISAIADFVASTDAALMRAFPGRAAGRLRPPRRRQPALQRAGARRRAGADVPGALRSTRSTRSSTTRSRRAAARSRPSTASARSSATSWRGASRRSRST